jgi:anti-sigma factor RsiW
MMNCDEWKAFAHDYVLGDLSDPARELLDRHAGSCAACLQEAGLLESVDRRLREEPVLAPPPGLGRRALESLPARPGRDLWRVAAAVLLAGGAGLLSLVLPDEIRRAPDAVAGAVRLVPSFFDSNLLE